MEKSQTKRKKILKKLTKKRVIVTAIAFTAIATTTVLATTGLATQMYESVRTIVTGAGREAYADTPREKLNFNYDWKFSKGEGANNSGSDTAKENVSIIPNTNEESLLNQTYTEGTSGETWENVSLPHTYNDTDTFNNYMESAQNGERTMYTGTAWYTKEFTIPSEYAGKKIYIEFEAARQAAKISLNGHVLEGTYENGFIPFGYDLTNYINYGGTNKITVEVDNSFPYYMEGTTDAVPWNDSHWQPTMGGLYRNSYLYVVNPVQLTLPLYSFMQTEGTYIYTSNETTNTADINVEAQIQNNTTDLKNLKLVAYVKKANSDVALTIESDTFTVAAGEKTTQKISGKLAGAIRWSTQYPYLYTVRCKIVDMSTDEVLDNNETQIGIRTFKFTNDYGMYLNGNYTKLTGWGQKPTNEWAGLGSAYPDWMQDYVMNLMKKAGGNFVRWGHCAGSPTAVASSDKYGMITLQPGVEAEGNYGNIKYTTNTYNLRSNAFRDMIIYYRNNASILAWEIGNQTIANTNVAQTLVGYIQQYDHGNRTYVTENENGDYTFNTTENKKNTGSWANTIDTSTRVSALRQGDSTMAPYVDVGVTTQGGSSMNNASCGNKPDVEGEYNRLEARRGVWDLKTSGYEDFSNKLGSTAAGQETTYGKVTSEEFAKSQITSFITMIGGVSHSGGANWIFSDSTSHGRVISEVARASGEVDATMLPKESYWVDKVIFSNESSAHIIGHWNYTQGTIKDVYVAAKGTSSGITSGTVTVTDETGNTTNYTGSLSSTYLWTFKDVEWKKGKISAEFKDKDGNTVATDEITSHGEPASLKITPVNVGQTLYANGSDILLLDVEILDSNGNRCETFDGVRDSITTNFYVNNQTQDVMEDNYCKWRGGYNSSLEKSTNNKNLYIESGITRVALRTTMNAGQISVTAKTIVNGNELQDTYTTSTTAIDNTNGYSRLENYTPDYDLNGLTNPGVGDDKKPTDTTEEEITNQYSSSLIEDFNYTGTTATPATIETVLENGAQMYNDTNEAFTSVPYKYQNAEYLLLPSVDNATLGVDLINFLPLRDLDVLVFRDPDVPNPSWLTSNFTKTNDIVTGSNGVIYEVYKMSVKGGHRVTLGSNGENADTGAKGWMNIIAVKQTDKIANSTFFDESFQAVNILNSTEDSEKYKASTAGWNLVTTGTGVTLTAEEYDGEHTAHFVDTNTSAMGYIYKKFATTAHQFTAEFKVNVTKISGTNKFIRMFLNNGTPVADVNDLSKVLNEMYLNNTDLIYKTSASTSTSYNIKTGIANNAWHTITVNMDIDNTTFTVNVDGTDTGGVYPLRSNSNLTANNILIASGNSHQNDMYISKVSITPTKNQAITGIQINGSELSNFDQLTKDYQEIVNGSTKNITITKGEKYKSHDIIFASDNSYADITVVDTSNITYNYRMYFKDGIVNKTELRSVISEIEGMKSSYYTTDSWTNLLTQKNEAYQLLYDANVSLNEINLKIQELRSTIKKLVIK